jgi:murein DD-endopeptidase MepM/ murein hydrolase activator NlpD
MMVFWRRVYLGVATVLLLLWLGLVVWVVRQNFPGGFAFVSGTSGVAAPAAPLGEAGAPTGAAGQGWASLFNLPGIEFLVYPVAPQDTYSSVAKKFKLSENTLRSLNQANDGSKAPKNNSLLVPSQDGIFHIVGPGQGLSDIARAYGVSLKSILQANHLSGDSDLKMGQALVLPGAAYLSQSDVHWIALKALADEKGFLKPTTGRFADGFGPRINPISGKKEFHPGLDLAPGWRARVVAAQNGQVIFAGIRAGYGRLIILDHGNGLTTRYGHLDQILVKLRQTVIKGDLIGRVGMTGMATGPHLHFEVRLNGQPQNPLLYLTQ